MRLGTAIELLIDNYRYASDKEWIQDKVAWALYHTWKEADRKTEPTISKMEQVDKDINVRSKDEPSDCTEALTLLWIKNMVTDEEFYRIDARLKVMPQTERSE